MFGVRTDTNTVRKVSGWVSSLIGVPVRFIVVKEVQCKDENCVPIETLIIIFEESGGCKFKGKILKPMIDVELDDIAELKRDFQIDYDKKESHEIQADDARMVATSGSTPASILVTMKPRISSDVFTGGSSISQSQTVSVSERAIDTSSQDLNAKKVQAINLSSSSASRPAIVTAIDDGVDVRHQKGTSRARGCPCCDPDNLENLIDSYLFLETPP
jgi:hypothetical protein